MFGCWVWHKSVILHVFRRKLAALSKKRSLIILIIGMKKRLLSGLLAASMMFSLFPTSAFAAEDQGGGGIDPLTPAAQNAILDEENGEDNAEASTPTGNRYENISTEEALRNAVSQINSAPGGTYEIVLSNEITLTKSLEITNGAKVTIRPKEKIPTTPPEETLPADGNLLTVGKNSILTLKNITLQGPLTNSSASLLHVLVGAKVTLENCTLDGKSVDSDGNRIGSYFANGLRLYNAEVTMENSVIQNCYAANQEGAGARLEGSSTLTVSANSIIENCVRDITSGGGVYVGSSSVLNLKGKISSCKAGDQGGGVYLSSNSNATLIMDGGTISNCKAGTRGGGVYVYYSSTVEMRSGSKIEKCTAKDGGGVYLAGNNAELVMDNSTISGCKASSGNGGGVYAQGDQAGVTMKNGSRIENCTSTSANSSSGGGGVYLYGSNSKLILDNSTIQNCEHTSSAYYSGGGGVYLYGSNAQLLADGSASIVDCTANGGSGGGIYMYGKDSDLHNAQQGTASITIKGCEATGSSGGGIYVYGSRTASLDLADSVIYNNTAQKAGDDLYFAGTVRPYHVTLPQVAGQNLLHANCSPIDGWYPDKLNDRYIRTKHIDPVNKESQTITVGGLVGNRPLTQSLVACSAVYEIVFDAAAAETADCKAYSDRGCTEEITVAAPGDTVYLKYNGSLADDARMSWAAATDGDDAANRDVSVSDSGRVRASFTMPAVNINSRVTITPAVQTVTYYSIQVNAPEGGLEQAVTVVPSAEEGQTVSLVFDPAALPAGKTFGSWVVKKAGENGEIVPVLSSGSTSTSFIMPASDVVVAFTLNDAGQPDTSDKPSEGGGSGGNGDSGSSSGNGDSSGSGADAVIAGAVIGAAGYLAGTHVWLAHLYGFIPENRIQLALALWNRADCPEPESTELYPDIDEDDDDAQAAARWCVEQSLMKDYHKTDKEGHEEITFKPCRYVFRLQAIKAWYDLEDLLNEQQAAMDTVSESDFAK